MNRETKAAKIAWLLLKMHGCPNGFFNVDDVNESHLKPLLNSGCSMVEDFSIEEWLTFIDQAESILSFVIEEPPV